MDEAEDTKYLSPEIKNLAMLRARGKANIARWGLNIVIFLFSILITIIILISQGIGNDVVVPLAIFGLATVWFIGWRRGSQLYQRLYSEEVSSLQQRASREAVAFGAQLTSREIGVLNYMTQGNSNKQIAAKLYISEQTIKNHVTSILRKLEAKDRTEAVVIAIKHGLINLPKS